MHVKSHSVVPTNHSLMFMIKKSQKTPSLESKQSHTRMMCEHINLFTLHGVSSIDIRASHDAIPSTFFPKNALTSHLRVYMQAYRSWLTRGFPLRWHFQTRIETKSIIKLLPPPPPLSAHKTRGTDHNYWHNQKKKARRKVGLNEDRERGIFYAEPTIQTKSRQSR